VALDGYIDLCTESLIGGWAWDSDHPETRLDVIIFVDGRAVAQVTARQYRDDLKKSRIGDGTYGFSYATPLQIDCQSQRISAVVAGTDVYLPRTQEVATPPDDLAFLESRGSARLNWPPIQIEMSADDSKLRAMHEHVSSAWTQLGRAEPYWSVLTHPMFKAETLSSNADLFFDSGKYTIQDFCAFALRSGVSPSADQTCFELGCGVGRLTAWLSPMFSRVIAADVSANHLQIAKIALAQRGIRNATFHHIVNLTDLEKIGQFDVFFSIIVFQHNPPPIMAYMLRVILIQLKPNGIAYFQVPTYSRGYTFGVDHYLSEIYKKKDIEYHVLLQKDVLEIVYQCGCKLLEIREDGWTGDVNGVSNTFLVQKGS